VARGPRRHPPRAPLNPENLVKRSFKPLLKKAGLPDIRFHDVRNTCATLLLCRGIHPKFIQELLGHATIAMTLDTYSDDPGYLLALLALDG
jgi:integrase